MKLNENALKVLEKRYLGKDENGNLVEDPAGMFERVARAISMADKEYLSEEQLSEEEKSFYKIMTDLEFLPNSPTLMNAGRPLGQLSACFVLPVDDTMEDIFESIKNAALIHKSGGGTGFSFSRLRGHGSSVQSTGGVASGPISFMKVFNAATEAVKQGGTRRGANMGILRVDHPDIRQFITCKQDNNDITNFNISVGITEEFMKAVEEDRTYDIIDPKSKTTVKKENAREIFDMIIDNAWNNGEPGIIFLDRLNRDNVVPSVGDIESTNPCGEQPLLPFESCNLGSINLSEMITGTDSGGKQYTVDYDRIRKVTRKAVHFLDNVIDVNKYPLAKIDKMTKNTRKIGLGVMGWADMLCNLGVPYNSTEALELADKVMGTIREEAIAASIELAEKKGVFPYYDKSIFKKKGIKLRNSTLTTIAPTGTLSIIAGVSSGIEPLFAISYIRNVMDGTEMVEVNPNFRRIAEEEGFYSDELMKEIAHKGTLKGISEVPERIQKVFVTSHDISPEWHVKMQAAFQKHTDNAVSKTVNLCHDATKEDVRKVYELAYKTDCKGVTIYRDGSRDAQVLNIGSVKGKENKDKNENNIPDSKSAYDEAAVAVMNRITPRTRPDITTGFTEKVKIGCGNLYITVNYDEKGICEVFTNLGRGGGCPSQSEATSRLVSIALRSGMDVSSLVEQLKGIRCTSTIRKPGLTVTSCPDAIGKVIQKVMKLQNGNGNGNGNGHGLSNGSAYDNGNGNGNALTKDHGYGNSNNHGLLNEDYTYKYRDTAAMYMDDEDEGQGVPACPDCGTPVEHEGGCVVCRNCGYSKCG